MVFSIFLIPIFPLSLPWMEIIKNLTDYYIWLSTEGRTYLFFLGGGGGYVSHFENGPSLFLYLLWFCKRGIDCKKKHKK